MRKNISKIAFITFILCMCFSTYNLAQNDYQMTTYSLSLGMLSYMIALKMLD